MMGSRRCSSAFTPGGCRWWRATRRSHRRFAHEILNAKPYAFLDDAPLEERRTHAVLLAARGRPVARGDLGALDPAAIERVAAEARPEPRDADELHDALLTAGFLPADEVADPIRGSSTFCWPPVA